MSSSRFASQPAKFREELEAIERMCFIWLSGNENHFEFWSNQWEDGSPFRETWKSDDDIMKIFGKGIGPPRQLNIKPRYVQFSKNAQGKMQFPDDKYYDDYSSDTGENEWHWQREVLRKPFGRGMWYVVDYCIENSPNSPLRNIGNANKNAKDEILAEFKAMFAQYGQDKWFTRQRL